MKEYIRKIYEKYEWELDMLNYHPEEESDIEDNNYVYAWFTKGNNKKYFYIGKGKNKRYIHILNEIEDVEKGKYKGKHYKLLKEKYGIECEFLYEKLTACEASILEAYSIMTYMKKKEPLLNVILPAAVMEDEELCQYRDSYFYEKDDDKFLEFYS